VIAQVRDDINERKTSLNYYEIVHGGMGENAIVYVDRPHRYNGIGKAGMPPYLIDWDYVKTFNDDKVVSDFQIQVELDVPARLYILIDDRLTPAQWLRDDFQDTGDNIGMKRGGGAVWINDSWYDRKALSSIKSDDYVYMGEVDTLSVWTRDVAEPGVITLGPIVVDRSKFKRLPFGMYGIVAVALEETN